MKVKVSLLAWMLLAALFAVSSLRVAAAAASVSQLGETLPLIEAFSGHIAILPGLPGENLRATSVGKALLQAGIMSDLVWLTPEQMIDTNSFNAQHFNLAVYLGGEAFFQTVQKDNDAQTALQKYLAGGGTLLVLPYGPLPFYYSQAGKVVGAAPGYGLNIGVNGFDQQPVGRTLSFQANTNQAWFRFPAPRIPFPAPPEADQRWRAIGDPKTDAVHYIPLLTLGDERGHNYADGAAMVECLKGPLAGARAVYVWCSLLENPAIREAILRDGVRYALAACPPPSAVLGARRSPLVSGAVGEAFWSGIPESKVFWRPGPGLSKASPATSFQARWDSRRLYLALRCERSQARDAGAEDSLALEFGTNQAMQAPLVVDSQKGLRNLRTNTPPITCALRQETTFWRAELAIPWVWLNGFSGTPVLDSEWPFQITRMLKGGADGMAQIQVWSPLVTAGSTKRLGLLSLVADPYSDDFNDRSQVESGSTGWRLAGGNWRIEDGALLGENCVSSLYEAHGAMRGDQSWRDYSWQVRFRVESRGSDWRDGPWFGVRTRPDGDGYYLTFTDRDCQLHKVLYGISTTEANPLARAAWKPDSAWHRLCVEARANRIRAQVDERLLFEVKDDAALNLPSLRSGGLTLAARKAPESQGRTVVRFHELRVGMLGTPIAPGNPGDAK
jgi:hypothetical protein